MQVVAQTPAFGVCGFFMNRELQTADLKSASPRYPLRMPDKRR